MFLKMITQGRAIREFWTKCYETRRSRHFLLAGTAGTDIYQADNMYQRPVTHVLLKDGLYADRWE